MFGSVKGQQASEGMEHSLIKISLERVRSQKLHFQTGRANERTQNPRKLASKKKISHEPRKQHAPGDFFPGTQSPQQLQQPQIGADSRKGDDQHKGEEDEIVGAGRDPRVGG